MTEFKNSQNIGRRHLQNSENIEETRYLQIQIPSRGFPFYRYSPVSQECHDKQVQDAEF